jgi:hypothetical protein
LRFLRRLRKNRIGEQSADSAAAAPEAASLSRKPTMQPMFIRRACREGAMMGGIHRSMFVRNLVR